MREDPEKLALSDAEICQAAPLKQMRDKAATKVFIFTELKNTLIAMGNDQPESIIEFFTEEIYSFCRFDSLFDINEILTRGRRGQYGKVYGNFSITTFGGWYQNYMVKKAETRERYLHNLKFKGHPERLSPKENEDVKNINDIFKQLGKTRDKKQVAAVVANENYFKRRETIELILRGQEIAKTTEQHKK